MRRIREASELISILTRNDCIVIGLSNVRHILLLGKYYCASSLISNFVDNYPYCHRRISAGGGDSGFNYLFNPRNQFARSGKRL